VPDLDGAIAWATRCPGAQTGAVEVRPIWTIVREQGVTVGRETMKSGIQKQAAFYRAYLIDDRSLIPLTIALATIVGLWLPVGLASAVGPQAAQLAAAVVHPRLHCQNDRRRCGGRGWHARLSKRRAGAVFSRETSIGRFATIGAKGAKPAGGDGVRDARPEHFFCGPRLPRG
jgi:hypothetical protein